MSLNGIQDLLADVNVQGRPLSQRPQGLRDELIARAVGRVVAHELGHYLLQSDHHGERGLLRPHYSSEELIAPDLHPFLVSDSERQTLRRGIQRLAGLQAGR